MDAPVPVTGSQENVSADVAGLACTRFRLVGAGGFAWTVKTAPGPAPWAFTASSSMSSVVLSSKPVIVTRLQVRQNPRSE